jgi:hypothetical protein
MAVKAGQKHKFIVTCKHVGESMALQQATTQARAVVQRFSAWTISRNEFCMRQIRKLRYTCILLQNRKFSALFHFVKLTSEVGYDSFFCYADSSEVYAVCHERNR